MSDKENEEKHFGPLWILESRISDQEERTTRALATLGLLNDKDNPYSLKQLIAYARELAATYERWLESETLIKDIAVRLSGDQQITVEQPDVGRRCGLHFERSFPKDAVLQIWKKADEQFGEVQLLSLPLSSVPPEGLPYKKKYPNKQTLSVLVEPVDGQYSVHVDFTEPNAESAPKKPRALPAHKRFAWLAPIAFALAGLVTFLWLPQWLLQSRSRYAYGLVLIVLLSVGLNCLLLKNLAERTNGSEASQSVNTAGQFPTAPTQQTTTESQSGNRLDPLPFSTDGNRINPAMRITVGYTPRTEGQIDRAHAQMSPVVTIHAPDQIITFNDVDVRASFIIGEAGDVTSNNRIIDKSVAKVDPPTQIQTKTGENTDLFIVIADDKSSDLQKRLWVGVRFIPMQKNSGTVIAELFDTEGKLLW